MKSSSRTCFISAAVGLFLLTGLAELHAQQPAAIRGQVIDAQTREPVASAQITVVGTQRGTVSGADGRYLLPGVPAGRREIRVQYIGYLSVQQAVDLTPDETLTLDIEIKATVIDLEEIVVTAVAGQTSRAKLPFSVETITAAATPVRGGNVGSQIAGKAAGVLVTGSSGNPGTAPSIMLRAPTSINASGRSQEPLYIVDGVILSSSVMDIDDADIESIEIVKGAAAASFYGSRAANGVIQITTNRGQNVAHDNVRYTVRTEVGTNDLAGRFNLTQAHAFKMTDDGSKFIDSSGNTCDFIFCSNVQFAGQHALTGQPSNAWNSIQQERYPGQTYDHVERFFQGGDWMTNHVSVQGRASGTNYLVSYNRQHNEGIMPGHEGFKSNSFRINVDQSVRQDITVSASALYNRSKRAQNEGALFALTRMPAGVDLTMADPTLPGVPILKPDPFNDNQNPYYTMLFSGYDEVTRGRFLANVNTSWAPLEWLEVDANVAFDRLDFDREQFTPKGYRTLSNPQGTGGNLRRIADLTESVNASVTGQVKRRFGDLAAMGQVRYLVEREDYTRTNTFGSEFTADGVHTFSNIPNANITGASQLNPRRADGFFVIGNFDLKDRYIVDAQIRQDGSSLFGPDERRHWYTRIAGAYRITEEPWFNIGGLDELKLRYSRGTAGNTPSFSAQYETYSVGEGSISPQTLGNRDLKPEYATEQEFGIEALIAGRVSVDLTYAHTEVKDQLLQIPSLAFTGFTSQWQNAGAMESNTFEATLSAQLLRTRNATWNARVLFDRTRQEITALNRPAYQTGVDGQGLGNVFYVRPGEAIGTFYGFQFATKCGHLPVDVDCSQFQVNDDGYLVWVGGAGSWQNGWNTYTNEDGETQNWWGTVAPFDIRGAQLTWGTPFQAEDFDHITGERATFLPLGSTTPKFRLGLANTVTYRSFSVYGLVESVQGFKVYNQPLQWAVFQNYAGIMDQSGVPESQRKPVGYYDRLYGASGLQPSSAFVDDASFTKLRELSVRYRASRSMLDRLPLARGFEGLTLTATGRNLITWSKYDGYDPDVGSTGGGTGSAAIARVDGFSYPLFRTMTFGVELNF